MEAFGDEDWAKAAKGSNVANAVVRMVCLFMDRFG
jgi:hypothetical protein